MARRPVGWKRKARRDLGTIDVREGVAFLVPVKQGKALRVFTTLQAAIRAGVARDLARLMFRRDGPKDDPCGGSCTVKFDDAVEFVWCELGPGCDPDLCICRLREMWKDADGPHDEDRGNPGPGWKYRVKPGRGYRCICKPKPPIDDPT